VIGYFVYLHNSENSLTPNYNYDHALTSFLIYLNTFRLVTCESTMNIRRLRQLPEVTAPEHLDISKPIKKSNKYASVLCSTNYTTAAASSAATASFASFIAICLDCSSGDKVLNAAVFSSHNLTHSASQLQSSTGPNKGCLYLGC